MMRLISRKVVLYTEMLVDDVLIHVNDMKRANLLSTHSTERPVVAQVALLYRYEATGSFPGTTCNSPADWRQPCGKDGQGRGYVPPAQLRCCQHQLWLSKRTRLQALLRR